MRTITKFEDKSIKSGNSNFKFKSDVKCTLHFIFPNNISNACITLHLIDVHLFHQRTFGDILKRQLAKFHLVIINFSLDKRSKVHNGDGSKVF